MSNKIKILATIPSGFCFGLQHVSIDLFGACANKIEPHFLISKWTNGDFEKLISAYNFSFSHSWLGMFSRKMDWYNLKMSLEALIKIPSLYIHYIKLLKKIKPDVLFFANHHELILLKPLLWFSKTKVICHMHDPAPAIPFQKKTFAWYGKRVHHFIAISNNVKNRLQQLGCNENKISVVHNGIKLPATIIGNRNNNFCNAANWNNNVFIIGITGQMTETKGHEDVLNAFEIAYKQNNNLRLVFGGKKLEPLHTNLQAAIIEKQLQNVVHFSGWLNNAYEFYNGIDVFIMASRHDEGYGLVVAEAMACAKPVIITNSGGATEIVDNNSTGFIINKRDVLCMAEKILALANNNNLCVSFGNKAQQIVNTKFALDIAANNFYETIKMVIE